MPLNPEKGVKDCQATLKIPFASDRHAEIAYRVLKVDQEPRRNFVQKNICLVDDCIEQPITMPEHTPAPTPARAVYGYAFYLLTLTLFVLYVLWAFLPAKALGLSYLPDKYFAVLLPMLVLVGLSFFAFFIYPAINMSLTPDKDEMASVVDIKLLLKGSEKNSVNSWQEIQEKLKPVKRNLKNTGTVISNCKFCSGTHRLPKASDQIDTVHFMDLTEMNNCLFN
uniref:PIG-P domain-containing protein n=1 Tax=Glossina brevipalpis TaxID=37001 RepID=A0A1A9X465_9MUSC